MSKKYVSALKFGEETYEIKDAEARLSSTHLEQVELSEEEAKTLLAKYILVNANGDVVTYQKLNAEGVAEEVESAYIEIPKDKVIDSGELYKSEGPTEPVAPIAPIEPDPVPAIDEETATEEEKAAYQAAVEAYEALMEVYTEAKTQYDTVEYPAYEASVETYNQELAEWQEANPGLEPGKTYLKLVIANNDTPIFIPVEDLVESQEAIYHEEEATLEFTGFNFKTL